MHDLPLHLQHTINGRNPAQVDMVNISVFTGVLCISGGCLRFSSINSIMFPLSGMQTTAFEGDKWTKKALHGRTKAMKQVCLFLFSFYELFFHRWLIYILQKQLSKNTRISHPAVGILLSYLPFPAWSSGTLLWCKPLNRWITCIWRHGIFRAFVAWRAS